MDGIEVSSLVMTQNLHNTKQAHNRNVQTVFVYNDQAAEGKVTQTFVHHHHHQIFTESETTATCDVTSSNIQRAKAL